MNNEAIKLGIIGYPLSHSISPTIQAEALKSVGKQGIYVKFETPKEGLPDVLDSLIKSGFSGFNVTIPHKIEMLKYLSEIDAEAKKIGAVNTVKINEDGRLSGYNTDIYGFVESIPLTFKNPKTATLLGCGGAALSVVFGLNKLGVKELRVCARNLAKAQSFVEQVQDKVNMKISIENISEINSIENDDILINATPLGTKGGNEDFMPIESGVLKTAKENLFVYDLVYNPAKTLLLQETEKLGLNFINGLDMLILQGARAFEIWTGLKPDVEKMKNVAISVL